MKQAFSAGAGHGNAHTYMGSVLSFLVPSQAANGRIAIIDASSPRGIEPPPHFHEFEDETCYILEGQADFYTPSGTITIGRDQSVFVPSLVPHTFLIRSDHVRMVIIVNACGDRGVGLDGYFSEMAAFTAKMDATNAGSTHATIGPEHATEIGARYGIILLSPEEAAANLPTYAGFGISAS